MTVPLAAVADGCAVRVDGEDVAAWRSLHGRPHADDPLWREHAQAYVDAHPRPPAGGGPTGVAAAQRLLLLRRLAAGPASRADLLAAMRSAGWVGASDFANRVRELAGSGRRTPGARAVRVVADGGRFRLAEPFPLLDPSASRALAFAKSILAQLDGPLPLQALAALDGLLPGLRQPEARGVQIPYRASPRTLEIFTLALEDRRPVRIRYFSLNSGFERDYDIVPLRYVPGASALKAIGVPVNDRGQRTGPDRQFALERLVEARPLPHWQAPDPAAIALRLSPVTLDVTADLYRVMVERDLFGIACSPEAEHSEIWHDVWRVRGAFPVALAWDVMEQLCAWAGTAQVHEPLWLVNAVCRRLRAGLRVMEAGDPFTLVKPDVDRTFASHGAAVTWEGTEPDAGPGRARRLSPRGRRAGGS